MVVMVNWFYYGNARSNKKTRTDKFGGRFTASVTRFKMTPTSVPIPLSPIFYFQMSRTLTSVTRDLSSLQLASEVSAPTIFPHFVVHAAKVGE